VNVPLIPVTWYAPGTPGTGVFEYWRMPEPLRPPPLNEKLYESALAGVTATAIAVTTNATTVRKTLVCDRTIPEKLSPDW